MYEFVEFLNQGSNSLILGGKSKTEVAIWYILTLSYESVGSEPDLEPG